MTKLAVPSGVPLAVAGRRLSPGYMLPQIVADGAVGATSLRARATATASATPHTKGAWTQIVAATTSPISVVSVSLTASTFLVATDTSALLDIGIGAAAAEEVIVPNLTVGWRQIIAAATPSEFIIPVRIPVGSRVAVRCQGAEVSKNIAVQLVFGQLANLRPARDKVIDMGTNLATSGGTTLATPGAGNTKGAWTQIAAATPQPFDALAVGIQGAADTVQAAMTGLLDVGLGASGSEVVFAPDLPLASITSEALGWLSGPATIPCRLPAGTRLAARWAISSTLSTFDVILYGIPA